MIKCNITICIFYIIFLFKYIQFLLFLIFLIKWEQNHPHNHSFR